MKLPIFTTIVILSAISWICVKTTGKKFKEQDQAFWEKELKANSVRKQPLNDLVYVEVPFDTLPFGGSEGNDLIRDCEKQINSLRDAKIVNLNGISNTDLKLRYGVANLTTLTEYDQNYITLVQTLSCWGKALYEDKRFEDAITVLECGINAGTDVRLNYTLLADLYVQNQEYDKVDDLLKKAEALTSITRNSIVSELRSRSVFSPSYK